MVALIEYATRKCRPMEQSDRASSTNAHSRGNALSRHALIRGPGASLLKIYPGYRIPLLGPSRLLRILSYRTARNLENLCSFRGGQYRVEGGKV